MQYRKSLQEMVLNKYNNGSIQMMDTKTVIKFFGYQKSMQILSDTFWHIQLQVGETDDPFELCSSEYNKFMKSEERQALIFTLPEKIFDILKEEKGKQVLFDSHVHYTDTNMSSEESFQRDDLHGVIAVCDKNSNMLMYVFAHVVKELRCSTDVGCMYRITSKKKHLDSPCLPAKSEENKKEINEYKRKLKNDNFGRDGRRSMAIKNSLWYDLNCCKTDWNESILNLLKLSTSKMVHIEKRIQYFGILKVSEKLEKAHLISLKELHEIYSTECNNERSFCGLET